MTYILSKEEQQAVKQAEEFVRLYGNSDEEEEEEEESLINNIAEQGVQKLLGIILRLAEDKERRFLVQEGWNRAIDTIRDRMIGKQRWVIETILDEMYDYS